jgi:hypothetical protein
MSVYFEEIMVDIMKKFDDIISLKDMRKPHDPKSESLNPVVPRHIFSLCVCVCVHACV